VSLVSNDGKSTFGSSSISITTPKNPSQWTEVTATIKPTKSASNTNNTFTVSVDGAAFAGQTIEFAMFSLMPPTFKNRPNGMRIDIAEVSTKLYMELFDINLPNPKTLAAAKPSFFRFPGGNSKFTNQTILSHP
jgi:alpha-N-arabinofuranosidase